MYVSVLSGPEAATPSSKVPPPSPKSYFTGSRSLTPGPNPEHHGNQRVHFFPIPIFNTPKPMDRSARPARHNRQDEFTCNIQKLYSFSVWPSPPVELSILICVCFAGFISPEGQVQGRMSGPQGRLYLVIFRCPYFVAGPYHLHGLNLSRKSALLQA
ncbi:uncharacterized protein F4812DRAFT_469689 [Daldinia caldariorum]|uniref:uncharacterized protein n=1 Tax=Daldinia caldariorum TaxID=326644 RepID=UPI0020089E25|nr:uncharacterized protein F4812DRAFT_469689 [Daldinia caldariorum]KAI1462891.1 hypothetical protein F4812DRAFT_469689 [Daldinia caldariorum]